MSSLRAIQLPTEPVVAAATQAYVRPRLRAEVPPWQHDVEGVIRVVGRLGLGPIPAVLAVLGVVLSVTARAGS